jgi:hypothetical protein
VATISDYFHSLVRAQFERERRRQVEATLAGQMPREQLRELQRQGAIVLNRVIAEQERQLFGEPTLRRVVYSYDWHCEPPPPPPTPEQVEAARVRREEYYRAEAERQATIRAAHDRSMLLLKEHLTPEQRKELKEGSYFSVIGGTTGNRYNINVGGFCYNIEHDHARICCTPGLPGIVPGGDIYLGQKLALELDEENFLDEANIDRDPEEW